MRDTNTRFAVVCFFLSLLLPISPLLRVSTSEGGVSLVRSIPLIKLHILRIRIVDESTLDRERVEGVESDDREDTELNEGLGDWACGSERGRMDR